MGIKEAVTKAKGEIEKLGLNIGTAMDDGEYYIFSYIEEVDISPIGVNKTTGEIIPYFPPEHLPEYLKAININI